jgi:hypothetical protein
VSEIEIVLSFIVVGLLIGAFTLLLGKERKNVHGCTGGGLTVEKSTKENE